MAGRFPGARTVAEFWRNQLNGIESISRFGVAELEVENARDLLLNPDYVPSRSVLDDVDLFDAEFFGIYPREAELMDPQQRLFLECCWQTLEDAGYDPYAFPGSIGVYAGSSPSTYFLSHLCTQPGFIQKFTSEYQIGSYTEMVGNSLDFLATRVSYLLNLRGPSITMLSACSTSLVAVTQACQALLTYQCDMALAGGVSVTLPQKRGTLYQEGGMVSPDGHCRAFDADARGTVFGSGVAAVLLKRLEDALNERDQIYAVIRGFAINNDGATKVGYTAPSVDGQKRAIMLAQASAGVDPDTIGYVEAHGTGTPLGDPIELTALTQAFRAQTSRNRFCAIGTAKTNVGHLDVAAGVTGLINATNIVRNGVFPPTLHFNKANPNFDLENSPFFVNTTTTNWTSIDAPRRAGVSAFGVGGTNAHVVIEQAPNTDTITSSSKLTNLLVLSGRTEEALEQATDNLAAHLKANPEINLVDAAWTLQVGRRAFPCRRAVTAHNLAEAVAALSKRDRARTHTRLQPKEDPQVCFLFPGQGSQHPNMGREIYISEPRFRKEIDQCSELLLPHLGADLRSFLYPADDASDDDRRRVTDTIIAQPALFTVEYALAQLWMSWGVLPKAMLGHSVGELVAACLAGTFSLEDALAVVAARGRMMQRVASGGMLSVRLSESELVIRLPKTLSIAAVNAPSLCVVAGPSDELNNFEKSLEQDGVVARHLVTSHAFHSAMMDPVIEPFTALLSDVQLNCPQIPYLSGVTGTWITDEQATNSAYWARHVREPVRFSPAISELLSNPDSILVEVGPGNVLSTLARQHIRAPADRIIAQSLSDISANSRDSSCLMNALGSLWVAGVQPNWQSLHLDERPKRISLPTYPFKGKRFWLGGQVEKQHSQVVSSPISTASDVEPLSLEQPGSTDPMSSTSASQASDESQAAQIRSALIATIEDLSGMDLTSESGSTSFIEMGFDSLFLTQVAQALQSKFGVKVTFRQLLGEESTMDALTQYLGDKVAPEKLLEAVPASTAGDTAAMKSAEVPPVPAYADVGMTGTPIERLMREQLQAMNALFTRQLDAVRGMSPMAVIPLPERASTSVTEAPKPLLASVSLLDSPPSSATITATTQAGLGPHGPFRPARKESSGELNHHQQQHLNALIERHTKRTAKSKDIIQADRTTLADPRVVSGFRPEWKELVYPFVTERSAGSRLWDVDGNEYIDIVNGFGSIMFGHRPDFVVRAIEKQLHEGFEIGPQTSLAGDVARLFCKMTGNERMTFCNTGSEAVMAAMRVARTVTGRSKVVMFSGDYHGTFDEVLVKGLKTRAGILQSAPIAPGIPRDNLSNVIVLDYGTSESLAWIRDNAGDVAAVLVEPVQSRHPSLQPVEFLREVRKITQDAGVALIFDEIVTGFRAHQGGCQALFGVRADLATYGKVIAGGMPIGILAGKSQFMDALDGGMWQFGDQSYPEAGVTFFAGTFVRHPLTVAAAKAVMHYLDEQGPALQESLTGRTAELVRQLNELIAQYAIPTKIETFGSMFYFGFSSEERFASLFYYYLRDRGIHVREGFPCFLTTAHSERDIEAVVDAFRHAAMEMKQAGFFVGRVDATSNSIPATAPSSTLVPLTEAQLEVWLADQLGDEASCSFNESFALQLRGDLHEREFLEALEQVINRHDALRAKFSREGDFQCFEADGRLAFTDVDLTTLSAEEQKARIREIIKADASTPFQLSEGKLVRAQLLKLDRQNHIFIFTAHHIVCDGWSTNVLLQEIAEAYNTMKRRAIFKPESAMSFAAYARSQADFFGKPEGAIVEQYWLEQFKDLPPLLDLPLDRQRPAMKDFSGATYRRKIDASAYNRIKRFGASQKCTLFVTLLAGFQALLARLSGQEDIVVGVPTAGQSLIEDATLVGHCVNFIPLRGRLNGRTSVAEFLTQLKNTVLAGYEHQNYTYGRLVRKLSVPRDPSRLPLTEVQFNLERVADDLKFDGLDVTFDPNPKSFVNFDLFFNVMESEDGLVVDCDYNSRLFNQDTIARWLAYFEVLLEGMSVDPSQPINSVPLIASSESQSLLQAWNDTAVEDCGATQAHQQFEDQVQKRPHAIAATFGDQKLTYAEFLEGKGGSAWRQSRCTR
jgi:acyl transferase domain-containing protein/acetylornithine/succinyldiaminopimelate/putrescine aminotransferase